MAAAIGGGLGIGAGVGISSVALAPFNAANTFMGSAFFGYGMILGERYMYQADWPKIQARLENGEKIENIIQEYTGLFTAVVMKEAKIIFDTVTQEFIQIMKQALSDLVAPPDETQDTFEEGACPPGFKWSKIRKKCIPTTVTEDEDKDFKPPPPKKTDEISIAHLSQGRVIRLTTGARSVWEMQSFFGGNFHGVKRGNQSSMVASAMASWPSKGYKQFTFTKSGKTTYYWVLKSKL